MNHRPIFFLTDFGHEDPFAGLMKARALAEGHRGQLVDLTHAVPPQDVLHAAILLEDCLPWLPPDAVVCAVVDPGVGSARRAIAAKSRAMAFIAPDNGLLTPVLRDPVCQVRELDGAAHGLDLPSTTFHGRDLFAPIAARIAAGQLTVDECGHLLARGEAVHLDTPAPTELPGGDLQLSVLAVDHFGNATLNLRAEDLPPHADSAFYAGDVLLGRLRRTYADVPIGMPVAYVNSAGRIELGVRNGNAARELRLSPGSTIVVKTTGTAT